MELNLKKDYYLLIAEKLNEILPNKWSKVFLYSEVHVGVVTIILYFLTEDNKLYQEPDIYNIFDGDEDLVDDSIDIISDYIESLNKDYIDSGHEKWTNMTFLLDSTGKLKVEFGYEDLTSNLLSERREKWKNKYLKW